MRIVLVEDGIKVAGYDALRGSSKGEFCAVNTIDTHETSSVEQEPAPDRSPAVGLGSLRRPVFLLWGTWLTANICMWMNEVASAWLMTTSTTSP